MRQISKELYKNLKNEGRLGKLEVGKKEYERTGNFLFIESADVADEDKLKEYNKENKTELYFYLISDGEKEEVITGEEIKDEEPGEIVDPETITEGAEETEEEKPKAKSHKGKNKKEDEGHGA